MAFYKLSKLNPELTEKEFFEALVIADHGTLDDLLADDFVLIDVMTGSQVSKAQLLRVVADRTLRFEKINRMNFRVRFYGIAPMIKGQTELSGTYNGDRFEANRR